MKSSQIDFMLMRNSISTSLESKAFFIADTCHCWQCFCYSLAIPPPTASWQHFLWQPHFVKQVTMTTNDSAHDVIQPAHPNLKILQFKTDPWPDLFGSCCGTHEWGSLEGILPMAEILFLFWLDSIPHDWLDDIGAIHSKRNHECDRYCLLVQYIQYLVHYIFSLRVAKHNRC